MFKKILLLTLVLAMVLSMFCGCTITQESLEAVRVSDKLKNLYDAKCIGLTSVKNPRDLGGYVNADGKKVKRNLLVRSGHLAELSEEDGKILKEKYDVKEIVDFRIVEEIGEHYADKVIDGANYQRIDVISKHEGGDPVGKNYKVITGDGSTDMMISYYKTLGTLDDMYYDIVNSPIAFKGYRKFFDILLKNDGGTVFHCSTGKDRTGFATVYILTILGVDRKTILDDYEVSNVFYEKIMNGAAKLLKDAGFTNDAIKEITRLLGVDRTTMENALNMIDKNYGGVINYLRNQIGLTEEEMDTLRNKYLE